jgi:hypothetical protein
MRENHRGLAMVLALVLITVFACAAGEAESVAAGDSAPAHSPLPPRLGDPTRTTGNVPHVQIGVDPIPAVHAELLRRTFLLPDVEERPTIVSLPGGRGVWLNEGVPIVQQGAIVAGREFTHIHVDGSLHAPLPTERAIEAVEAGWAERHPWAERRDGWQGLVMLFTPQSMAELEIVLGLIVESYNFVTGRNVHPADI